MRRWRVVLAKELRDGLRDRRAVLSLALLPLIGPALVALMLGQLIERAGGAEEVVLPVVGTEHAPELVRHLERNGIRVVAAPAEPSEAVRAREVELVMVVDEAYGRDLRASKPATVELVIDASREEARASVSRVRAAIDGYGRTVGSLRLLARGVAPDVAEPIRVEEVDLSTPATRAAMFLSFIPMFVLLAAFMGGMYTATDTTAGERERGSLEPLLLAPVPRAALVVGKWLASVVFAAATVLSTFGGTVLALGQLPLGRIGLDGSIDPAIAALMLGAVLPVTLFTCGLQVLVASFARSYKEAQTYLSFMALLPMLAALFTVIEPMRLKAWMPFVPVMGQHALVTAVIRGEMPPPHAFVTSAAASALAGIACVLITARLFQRERIVYGR